jgi:lysozyme family protein
MKDNFDACLRAVLKWEGGKVDDPRDNGGRTNQGITQRVYTAWRAAHNKPKRDVYLIEPSERNAIYRAQYWEAIDGDNLPLGLDYMMFDAAVLSGPVQAIKWLQRALQPTYQGLVDGQMGTATKQALRICSAPRIIDGVMERRLAFFKQLKDWPAFGKGWTRRLTSVHAGALDMARSGKLIEGQDIIVESDGAGVKATIEKVAPRPTKSVADAATGGGIAAGSAAAAVESARASLNGLAAGSNEFVTKIVVALTLMGLVLTLGGLAFRWYQKRKEEQRADALDLPLAPRHGGIA